MTRGPAGRLVAALAASSLLAGCTAAAPHGASTSTTAAGAALVAGQGGSATVAVDQVPTTLNDHTVAGDTAATRAVASMVWTQVFQVGPRLTPILDTTVVQSAEVVSVAPQTVVYRIDPRATWSDGVPVTAQDFVYAWLAQAGPGRDVDGTLDSVSSTAGYRDIASVVGSDNGRTVTVVFQTPYADWEALFADLLPSHVAERAGWNHAFDRFDPAALVSAGPWLVASWDPGRQITLVRNPHWWGAPPRLDRLVLEAVPGAPAMAQALRAGGVQVAYPASFDPGVLAQVSSSPMIQSRSGLGATMLQLVFDVRHSPLDATEVRQGIAHVVDRAALVTTVAQPLNPLAWEDNDHLFANLQAWYTDDATGYTQPDTAAATRLLTAGGLVADPHGAWTLHGAPVVLRLAWASDDPWSAAVGPVLAAELVDSGFEVVGRPVPMAQLVGSVLPGGGFDLAVAPVTASAFPSAMAANFGTAGALDTGTTKDWSGFDDPHYDALFVQAAQELAAAQARQLYQQLDQALWTAMPTLPLFAEPTLLAWNSALSSVQDDPGGLGPLWGVRDWAVLVPAPPSTTTSRPAGTGKAAR